MRTGRTLVWGLCVIAAGFAVAVAIAAGLATREVARRQTELDRQSQSAPTRSGAMQYARTGAGNPVLVIHGAGGGFDQGLLIACKFGGDQTQWIAPSRFGYLASALPADASTAAQADAFADLLDHLGVERVSILAFSGGVPPALQFAERHPGRVACMAFLSSAPFTPHGAPSGVRPMPDWAYQALLGNDVIYWALAKTAPDELAAAFDVRPDLRVDLEPEEAAMTQDLVTTFLPASQCAAGVANEAAAIDPAAHYEIEAIQAPALIVHARDDGLNPFAIGEDLAARLPHARFLALERGGHLLLGHQREVRARVASFFESCPDAD